MLFEYFIIVTYFVTLMVPVAVVVAVFWLEANRPEAFEAIPDFETYPLPKEGTPTAEIPDAPPQLPGPDGTVDELTRVEHELIESD